MFSLSPAEIFHDPASLLAAERVLLSRESRAHTHAFAELVLVVGGEAEHLTDAGHQPIGPDTLLLLGPDSWHAYVAPAQFEVLNLYLSQELLELIAVRHPGSEELAIIEELRAPRAATSRSLARGHAAALQAELDGIAAHSGGTVFRQLAAFYSLADRLTAACADAPPVAPAPLLAEHTALGEGVLRFSPRVSRAISMLHTELTRAWTLAELAARLHVSPSQLTRAFRADVRVGPMSYLQRLRAERMAYLLRTTGLTAGAAGRAVGWHDPSYASRRFSAHWGTPPAAYRARTQLDLGRSVPSAAPEPHTEAC